MKMKLISTAVAAGLGLGLMSTAAQAVYVNANGTGQALIYPYVTTENGYSTNVAVVNTTNNAKVVKVRFLEAKNSNETLDFNLYLSAHDEWTGAISDNGTGPMLVTHDTSCTAPAIPAAGVAFRNTLYAGDSDASVARAREGYMEVISMGDIAPGSTLAQAITHVNGTPANCSYVINNALDNSSVISNQLTVDSAGLYGYGALFNVARGTSAAYDATALNAITSPSGFLGYSQPGSTSPSLGSTFGQAVTFNGTAAQTTTWTGSNGGWNAVAAVLMASDLVNDYVVDPTLNAGTDWVVTFPTKRNSVNQTTALPPFTVVWDKTKSQACEPIAITYYNREEGTTSSPIDFSPMPTVQGASLCYEANTITFNNTDVLGALKAGSTGAGYNLNLASGFTAGWADLNFTSDAGHQLSSNDTTPVTFHGLPAVGFAITQFTNGNVGGLLANYATLSNHKKLEIAP